MLVCVCGGVMVRVIVRVNVRVIVRVGMRGERVWANMMS